MAHVDHIYRQGNDLAEGHLGQNLTIWRKSPNGITKIFAESPYDRTFSNESYKWRDLPLENTECLDSLDNMSFKDAEHVLCVECYQLNFVFMSPRRPKQPKHSYGYSYTFTTDTYGEDIVFNASYASEILKTPPSMTEQWRYLVIAASDKIPSEKQYHLLDIEPVGNQFWKRVDFMSISVELDRWPALHKLHPCRTRILLI